MQATKTIASYRNGLRSAVRGLWSGALDRSQFNSNIRATINNRLSQAFEEGAAEFDIKPDEFTQEEFLALGKAIKTELANVKNLADRIQANDKASGGKLSPLMTRVNELWVNRYRDIRNQGKILTGKNQKLVWRLGATEQHCTTCPKLDGKVKRASEWNKSGIRPQNPPNGDLECGGWQCLCELKPTNLPISRGRLPRF